MSKILYWLPRLLSLFITGFWLFYTVRAYGLSLTALSKNGVWIALLVFSLLAWRGQLIGRLGFILMAVLYVMKAGANLPFKTVALTAGPLLFIGLLYFFDRQRIFLKPVKETLDNLKKKYDDKTKTDDQELI